MLVSDVLGNVDQGTWADRLVGVKVDVLRLDQWEAQKNRLRKLTEGGTEVALSLDRHTHLHDGDIVAFDGQTAIVARLDLGEVMVVDLSGVPADPPDTLIRTAIEVGHAIGNQHWPAVIKGAHIYVPLTVDRKVTAAVMKTHGFEGVTYDFISGAEVLPFMAPHEARRLFGGAGATPHTHTPIG
jgi:urease accessory protein